MLTWFKKLGRGRPGPIGIDLGADSVRLSQVRYDGSDIELVAALTEDVPSHLRRDPTGRIHWFAETHRELLAAGGFVGRQVNIGFSGSTVHVLHVRLPKMDTAALRQAALWEARGKVPIDLGRAAVRHMVAGDIFQNGEQQIETILLATPKELIDQWMAVARKARLDIQGMTPDAMAITDCFGRVFRRKADAESTTAFVDLGAVSTRVVITHQKQLVFARVVPIGSDSLTAAVATACRVAPEEAKLMRLRRADEIANKPAAAMTPADPAGPSGRAVAGAGEEPGFALLSNALTAHRKAAPEVAAKLDDIDAAQKPIIQQLGHELELCRQYHEATFPSFAIDRVILVGGEARNRPLCMQLAEHVGLPVQVGDPMVRLTRGEGGTELIDELLDRKQSQPAWAVSLGLAMGPLAAVAAGKVA